MLKTMYQQFVGCYECKLTSYGYVNNDCKHNNRYYNYASLSQGVNMTIYINTPLAFASSLLPTLIEAGIVKVSSIRFSEISSS